MRLLSYHGAVRERPIHPVAVVSVHRRAINLLLASGELLCLVAPEVGNGPFTLVVEGGFDLTQLCLRWEEAERWEPPSLLAPSPGLEGAVRGLLADLTPADSGALPVILTGPQDRFGQHLSRGVTALADGRWAEAVERLVGLGPGLTPSGDDLLAGYLLTQRALTGGESPLAPLLRAIPERQTTPLGRHILRWAADGVAPERQMTWLASLLAGRPDPVEPILAIGATSGSDWLAGVLLAVHHAQKERYDETLRPVDSHRGGDPGLALL